jgi:hypothetical protein
MCRPAASDLSGARGGVAIPGSPAGAAREYDPRQLAGYTYAVVDRASDTIIDEAWHWPALDSKAGPAVDSVHPIAGSLWRVLFYSASSSGTGQLIVERVTD